MSAAKTAVRSARACAFAADFEGAAKEARETPEETDAARAENALEADFLADARRTGRCDAWPTYSRELSDPVEGGVVLSSDDAIVLCEGNYLLLGKLDGAEAERWRPLDFDESWFVRPQGGVPEQRDRVVERHLETWTEEKTAAWGAATAREGAEKRADANDVPNAYLVDRCRSFACLEVESL